MTTFYHFIVKYTNILKQLYTFLLVCLCSYVVTGQSEKLPNSFTYKVLGVDTYSPHLEELYNFDKQTFAFSAEYSRYIGNSISLSFPFRLGTMEYPYDVRDFRSGLNFYAQDVAFKYGFAQKEDKKIRPYISAGLGFLYLANAEKTWVTQFPIEQKWETQFPIELGVNYEFVEGIFLQLSTSYRFSTGAEAWHNGIGIQFQFETKKEETISSNDFSSTKGIGSDNSYKNTDIDFFLTVLDDHHASFAETEDSDKDGVPNSLDLCPNIYGEESCGGCPLLDDDMDGLANHEDRCPDIAGEMAFAGCPDTDGDRIANMFDLCPDVAGTRSCKGCPDMDNDKVPDAIDKCPTESGQADNEGCPKAKTIEDFVFKGIIKPIIFEGNQYILDRAAVKNLDYIILVMNRYPNFILSISQTIYDNENISEDDMLSNNRVKSCFQYLTRRGILKDQITYQYLGSISAVNNINLQQSIDFQLSIK